MTAHLFRRLRIHRFHLDRFRLDRARLDALLAPRKPRQPLLRAAFGLVGLALLAVLLVLGLFVGAAMLASGLLLRLWRQRGKPIAAQKRAVEGEYRVLRKPGLPFAR